MNVTIEKREARNEANERVLGLQVNLHEDSEGSHAGFFLTGEDLESLLAQLEDAADTLPGEMLSWLHKNESARDFEIQAERAYASKE